MRAPASWLSWLLPPATMLVIVVAAVLVLTTPPWMHRAIPAADGGLPGGSTEQVLMASDQTVNELLFGPGTFQIQPPCPPGAFCGLASLYKPDEIAHLRDARAVLYLFVSLAAAAAVLIGAALVRAPRDPRRWRAIARGGAGLAVGVVVLGAFAIVAFDTAFELFHRIFFPGGNWAFPADSNMIRLYPYAFWQLTAVALGGLCIILGGATWWIGRHRAASLEARR